MARNNRAISRANRNIQDIAKGISTTMDALYKNTYMSSPQQGRDLQDLNDRINDNINRIVSKNMDTIGTPSVSKLYARAVGANGGVGITDELERMFNNGIMTDDLYAMFMSNRYLKDLDDEIDTVCRYMPKLEEALEVQRDCVLSADHFSKDFLSLTFPGSGVDEKVFSERAKDLKTKYELAKLVEEIYEDTSKYGEKFIYRVPYATAIGKLLATKPNTMLIAPAGYREGAEDEPASEKLNETFLFSLTPGEFKIVSEVGGEPITTIDKPSIITEVQQYDPSDLRNPSAKRLANKWKNAGSTAPHPILSENERFNIGVKICKSGIIESAVRNHEIAIEKKKKYSHMSMASMHEAALHEKKKDIQATGNISLGTDKRDERILSANDGLIPGAPVKPIDVKIPGCVVKKLKREQVVPIYIEDICMGYYYFELRSTDVSDTFMGFKNMLGDPLTNVKGDRTSGFNSVDAMRQDETIRFIASQLSSFIDKQFVNNNQDLAKEIYMILKYNDLFNTPSIDMITVTFIPPEDMVHFFFKQDPDTHRGISDLAKGLIPAKMYSSLYMSSTIGQLTRGQDKRVYYVKQTVDTNIAQTLLNTIAQIKQGNFGVRQFQNINNILNIIGRFNDYVIPTNSANDPPIQFEVMPGQDIQQPTELMESLEGMAVNSTGIPIEIIQARQSIDYAAQLTMSSSKVLRFAYKRQDLFQDLLTQLITPIYNYEYDESATILVVLPPPSFINITNTNQLVDNTKNFVDSIIEKEMADEEDEKLKQIYAKELFKHYLGTHLDISAHQAILDRCRIIKQKESKESHSDEGGASDY